MTGLIVAPTSCIACPMPGTTTPKIQQITVRPKVTSTFYLLSIPFSLNHSSSIVSFEGRTQRGAAQITENKIVKFPI